MDITVLPSVVMKMLLVVCHWHQSVMADSRGHHVTLAVVMIGDGESNLLIYYTV